jgi:hypothetical protein
MSMTGVGVGRPPGDSSRKSMEYHVCLAWRDGPMRPRTMTARHMGSIKTVGSTGRSLSRGMAEQAFFCWEVLC